MEEVRVRDQKTDWRVIVQESYDTAIGSTLDQLRRDLLRFGLIALGFVVLVLAGVWGFVTKMSKQG